MIVRMVLFATAREAAGCSRDTFELPPGAPLERALSDAVARYGDAFAQVLVTARVWLNGDDPAGGAAGAARTSAPSVELHDGDEIAVLPPVSGGAGG